MLRPIQYIMAVLLVFPAPFFFSRLIIEAYTAVNAGAYAPETPATYDELNDFECGKEIRRYDMKAMLMIALGITLFGSVGAHMSSSQSLNSIPVESYGLASNEAALTGTWYGFPAGMLIRFEGDGRAVFGLAAVGETAGTDAVVQFEQARLLITFSNYDGDSEVCKTAVGAYQVQMLGDGRIRFVALSDECQFRVDALSGQPELGFAITFHPFN